MEELNLKNAMGFFAFATLQVFLVWFVIATKSQQMCQEKCGNITIPYPFGKQKGCYLNESYHVECNSTTLTPRLRQTSWNFGFDGLIDLLEVVDIQLESHQLRVMAPAAYVCFDENGQAIDWQILTIDSSMFPFSTTRNRIIGVGCGDTQSLVQLFAPLGAAGGIIVSCTSACEQFKDVKNGSCTDIGCCQANFPDGERSTLLTAISNPQMYNKHVWNFSKCSYAFIADPDHYKFVSTDLTDTREIKYFPLVLDWSVGDTDCKEAQRNETTYLCQENSECYNGQGNGLRGYRCQCSKGYQGNPYIANGCIDINECEDPDLNNCSPGQCRNTEGGYTCVCPKGSKQDGKTYQECIATEKSEDEGAIRGIGAGVGVAVAVVAMILMFWGIKIRRRRKGGREDFFKQNGGIMLQKLLSACEDPVNKAKIFTEEEMMKATDNFSDANIIGRGGYGTVYKGTLANKTMVAIKKSNVIDQSQIKQFVNEVIILSQIRHTNIVKLLGCCLETHVPLLVYEYITNMTLCHHLDIRGSLAFETRLKIAVETAEARAYMHSTTQIIHRDVKPSNILLNDEFTAKVSDFGISRYVPLGKTHLSTFAKGTIGYMDPEYFRTSKLTEKSDVYSFGIVLIELLTGAKIHSFEIPDRVCRGVAAYFASLLKDSSFDQVLDDQMKIEEYADLVKCVAKLAINCLAYEGKKRPTMTEVKEELKELRRYVLSLVEAKNIS